MPSLHSLFSKTFNVATAPTSSSSSLEKAMIEDKKEDKIGRMMMKTVPTVPAASILQL